MRTLKLLPLALVLFGCKGGGGVAGGDYVPKPVAKIPPATVKAGEETTLLPLAVGNQWTFNLEIAAANDKTQRTGTGEVTLRVAEVQPEGDGKRAIIETVSGGKVGERQIWMVNSKGIFQTGKGKDKMVMFSSPQPVVLFPVETGKTFKWSGNEGNVKRSYESKIEGPQEIDTVDKRLSAIAIRTTGTNTNGKIVEKTDGTIWLSPGIGIVRYGETSSGTNAAMRNVLKLKSYTLK